MRCDGVKFLFHTAGRSLGNGISIGIDGGVGRVLVSRR